MPADAPKPSGPLADLVVIELGTLIAGPFCGQILADFGAEVIKLEDPGAGDPMRQWGRSLPQGHSPWWPVIGRGKKSVTLNLRSAEGQQIARELIGKADVLVENFRPGTMEKWGMGYAALADANPRLIMARVSGFGQTGPYATRAGYGLIGEAMGGLRAITGEPDRPPARAGVSIGDSLAATHAAMGVLMALHVRETTGRGQVIDASIYESVLAMMENTITEYDITGYIRERSGAILPGIAPSNVYPTKDGMILIGGNGDTVFARLCEAMGESALKDDPRYASHAARGLHQAELDAHIAEWTSARTLDELLALLEADGVPCGRVFRAPDMLADPQYQARNSIVAVEHPVFGPIRMQNAHPKLSETPGEVRWPGAALGEHTAAVLAEKLGVGADRLAELKAAGVVWSAGAAAATRDEIVERLERLPPSRAVWGLIVLLSLGGCFEFYDLMMTAYISPVLAKAGVFHQAGLFGLPDQASFVAATFLGLFIGTIAVSQVADRFGRRRVFIAALLWYTAAAVIMALQNDALGIDVWRLIAGVGIGVELVTIDTFIAELAPRSIRGRAFAVNQAIQFLAVPIVAFAAWQLGPLSVAGVAGWRCVILLGAAAAIAVWLIQLRLPESPRWLADHGRLAAADAIVAGLEAKVAAEIRGPLPPTTATVAAGDGHVRLSDIFRPPLLGRTALLVTLNAFQAVGFYGFTNWAPTFLAAQGVHFAESLEYGFIIAAAYPIGPLIWSAIAERFERKWLVVAACAGTGLLGLAFAAMRAPPALIALGVAINFSNNLLSFSYHAYQAELYPTRVRATAVGFVYSWSRLSTVVSSYVIAWLLGFAGAPGAFGFIAAAMLVCVVSVALFGPPTRGRALEEIAR